MEDNDLYARKTVVGEHHIINKAVTFRQQQ